MTETCGAGEYQEIHDCEVDGVVVCRACELLHSIPKPRTKSKSTKAKVKTNVMRNLADAHNYANQHCTLDCHKTALCLWSKNKEVVPAALAAFTSRLKLNNCKEKQDEDGKDTDYPLAGTATFSHLCILDFRPHCAMCSVTVSMNNNAWKRHVASHFVSKSHSLVVRSSSATTQSKLAFSKSAGGVS